MFKKILIGLMAIIALLFIYVAVQPSEYKISREVTISASAEQIFPMINNAQQTEKWMPWFQMDPELKMSYSGPESGVGSKASWTSKGEMGTGSSTIVESIPNQLVTYQLEYEEPFQMVQTAQISILPVNGRQHLVKWSVQGKNNFIGRLMCLFMDMDKMVGSSFEEGLNKLKSMTESH